MVGSRWIVDFNGYLLDTRFMVSNKFFVVFGGIFLLLLFCIGAYMLTQKNLQKSSNGVRFSSSVISSPVPSPAQAGDFVFRGVPMFPNYRDGQVWMYEKYVSQPLR